MRKLEGGITIFLSLIFLLVIAFVCIVLESARISSAKSRAESITYSGINSCFAGYSKEVFEEYGVLGLWNSENKLVNNYKTYAGNNCRVTKDLLLKNANICGLSFDEVNASQINYITDNNGEIFAEEVYQYMKYKFAEDAIQTLLNKCNLISQGEKTGSLYKKIENCNAQVQEMEKSVQEIDKGITGIKEKKVLSTEYIEGIKKEMDYVNTNTSAGDMAKQNINNKYQEYKSWKADVDSIVQTFEDNANKYNVVSKEAERLVSALCSEVELVKSELSSDIISAVIDEIGYIKQRMPSSGSDYYLVGQNKKCMDEIKIKINDVDSKLDQYIKEDMKNKELVVNAETSAKQVDFSKLTTTLSKKDGTEGKDTYSASVKDMFSRGILALVIEDNSKLSNTSFDNTVVPSNQRSNKEYKWKDRKITDELKRNALFSQYVLDKYSNYTNQKSDSLLKYEAEYILYGSNNDKDNLAKTSEKIILIRSGFNLISILRDSQKRNEAYSAALCIAGATGIPAVIRLVQFGIIAAWSSAESVVDMRNLLSGEKVSLIKNNSEWNLSLNNITGISNEKNKSGNDSGLSYTDYLRFLLVTSDKADIAYRAMDVIELNMKNKYNSNFKMCECIAGANISVNYKIKRLFSVFGFVKNNGGGGASEFNFSINRSFKY